MRSRFICLLVVLFLAQPSPAQYRAALPGYRFEFPRDHFNHPDFQTEWWYYTGNLKSPDGHRFGFELTFFRQAVTRDPAKNSAWDVRDLYVAHLALTDLENQRFFHAERTNRSGPGIAGVNQKDALIWNGNWQVQWRGDEQGLQAVDDRFELHLTLRTEKRPVIHGENGVSQKASGPGRASHYISLTRLGAQGSIQLNGKDFTVVGLAWMDHEFFTHQLEPDQAGWDWLSLQLADNTELMLFRIRRKDGSIDPYSAGTFVDSLGRSTHLRQTDFVVEPEGKTWASPETHAVYPIAWKIEIPRLGLTLQVSTPLASQELAGNTRLSPSYWEGAISLIGRRETQPLQGVGYLEMTGYDRPFELIP
jgi:predicted secreted hydrolase